MSVYKRGYKDGERDTIQETLNIVASLVNMLGGEVRIPENVLVGQTRILERSHDPKTNEIVLKVL